MTGRRPPPGPSGPSGLPSRPPSDRPRGREDDYGGRAPRSAGSRGEEARYERGSHAAPRSGEREDSARYSVRDERDGSRRFPAHRDYSNEWGREQDERDRRGPTFRNPPQRWQRERSRSPLGSGSRWGDERNARDRSPPSFGEGNRGAFRRSPSPTGPTPNRSRTSFSGPTRDSGYPPRAERGREPAKGHPERERVPDVNRSPEKSYRGEHPPAVTGNPVFHRTEPQSSPPLSALSRSGRSSPPLRENGAASAPIQYRHNEHHHQGSAGSPAETSRDSLSGLPNPSNGSPMQPSIPAGLSSGIPTGPKASFAARGRGRGGMPIRGGPHLRGTISHGVSGALYMPTGRGRGGSSTGWGARGRGGGIIGGVGMPGAVDDPPAKSLARKVDAGGNAVVPDLISVPSTAPVVGAAQGMPLRPVHQELEEGEREEGEREEGETDDSGTEEQMEAPVSIQRPVAIQVALQEPEAPQTSSAQSGLSLGTLPSRQPYGQQPLSSSGGGTVPGTPSTPAAATMATPGIPNSSHSVQNPYSASGWQRPAVASAMASTAPTTTTSISASVPPASTAARTVPSYTATNFSKSAQPEWDAELWTISAHRLAAIAHLPISSNFLLPCLPQPAAAGSTATGTPGVTGVPLSVASGLRSALTDLREAMTELDMASIRSQECERSRAEAAQL